MERQLTILVAGGSGFVGEEIVRQALRVPNVKVISVQRHIPKKPLDPRVIYIAGSCLSPETFKDQIREADVIVHSVGVIVDSVLKCKSVPGGPGSYEQMNYETARCLADIANSFADKKRKFFYVSGKYGLPFVSRQIASKRKTEAYVSSLDNLTFSAFYPGLVMDWRERCSTVPTGKMINCMSFCQRNCLYEFFEKIPLLGALFRNFRMDYSIYRADLAKAILFCALSDELNGMKVLEFYTMIEASRKLDDLLKP
jgi:nucleoside-diphosphate-sugar epimerase